MSHDHHHHEHDHPHPRQADVEDAPLTHHMALTDAVLDLLVTKGVVTAGEVRRALELVDAASPAAGARMIARAWVDPAYKERLLADANEAAGELGIDGGIIPVRAVESTPTVHNLIVCTLCSCYPRFMLGAAPDWYKARAYRSRAVREPRAVLREFGLDLPDNVRVEVHDSTAELRYMVLPVRPTGTEGWDEERLAGLVTRDCMIGVAVPEAH
jgi:nitrile hydratase alpha subunit